MRASNDRLLYEAAKSGNLEIVKELLFEGAETEYRDVDGCTPLFCASRIGRHEVVRTLLEYKANVGVQSKAGNTPLMTACAYCHYDIVCTLLEFDADAGARSDDGRTALMWASASGTLDTVLKLLDNGADVNAQAKNGRTALIWASWNGRHAIVDTLLDSGAEVGLKTENGNDALYWACRFENWDVAELLLMKGANPDVMDKDRSTARNHIIKHNKNEMLIKVQLALNQQQLLVETVNVDDKKATIDSKFNQLPKVLGRINEVKKELNRSKIMIVGEGFAGKTAFANSIIGKTYEGTESTVGINAFMCSVNHAALSTPSTTPIQSCRSSSRNKSSSAAEWKECNKIEKEYENAIAEYLSFKKDVDIEDDRKSSQIVRKKDMNGSGTRMAGESNALKGDVDNQGGEDVTAFAHSVDEEREDDGVTLDHSKGDSTVDGIDQSSTSKVDKDMIVKYLADHVENGTSILISIFDYGGQTVFNIIHQFFLTRYGIYALVFNMEWLVSDDMSIRKRCLEFIRFWLDSITVYTYDDQTTVSASIVIIGTRKDKVSSPAIHQQINTILRDTFKTKVAWRSIVKNTEGTGSNLTCPLNFFPIDNTRSGDDPVMKSVKTAIASSMNDAEFTHQLVPLSWMKTLDEVTNLKRSSISIEEYSSIASSCKVSSSDELNLLRYFHEMGYLMWHDQPVLRDVIILDPIDFFVNQATLIICKHIKDGNDPTLHFLPVHFKCEEMYPQKFNDLTKKGILHSSLLPILWEKFAEHSAILLHLMCRYGLLVPLLYNTTDESSDVFTSPVSEKYLVPSLLLSSSSSQYKEQWLVNGAYQTCYFVFSTNDDMKTNCNIQLCDLRSNGFLPNGLFERLVGKVVGWCQLTSKVVQIDTNLLFKDLAILRYGRQRFRLSLQQDLSSICLDVEGMNPLEVQDRILEQVKNCILESMKSLTVITALPLTSVSDKLGQLALKDEDMLVPIEVVRSNVENSLPLTGALGKILLNSQQTKERYGPWLKMYDNLEKYDIFVSYHKGPQDKELALAMFTMLSNFSCGSELRAVEVYLDERRLQHGKRYQDDFIQSIVNSTIVVPILSVDAIAKLVKHDPLVVDSILLEWICALEGYNSYGSRIKSIYPLFYGRRDPVTGDVGSVFHCEEFKQIPDIIPRATLSAAESLLIANKIFSTGFATKTVKSIVTAISSEFSGLSVDDDKQKNFLKTLAENLIKMLDKNFLKSSSTDPKMMTGDDAKHVRAPVETKHLSELSMDEVDYLLKWLNLSNFCAVFKENDIDGATLMNCKSADDVEGIGIDLKAKARLLYNEIVNFKSTGVPLTHISGVPLTHISGVPKTISFPKESIRSDLTIEDVFQRLRDIFSDLVTQAVTGNEAIAESLNYFSQQLEDQRRLGKLNVDAILNSNSNMGFDVLLLKGALLSFLGSSQGKGPSSDEVNKKLDILIGMVSNVKEQVSTYIKFRRDIRGLTFKIAQKQTHYPYTFVILPTVNNMIRTEPSSSSSSSSSSVFKFVEKNINNPYQALLWERSVLLFICPVSLEIMTCGLNGSGYYIKLSSSELRTIVPALRWGLFFLKAGLATQSLGSAVPDLASILSVIDDTYIRSIEIAIVSCVKPALDLTRMDNFDQVLKQTFDSITDEQDQAAFNVLTDLFIKKESGLHKEVSNDGSCSLWVSKESKQEFLERGLDAIKIKVR